ncbi:MAG: hypothetical protein J6B29_01555 [Clostridia bacterium]|nr:hypothetical protein [Clostridia bacterium]
MSTRFVIFTDTNSADYVIDGYGFKYVEMPARETATVMQEATQYKVVKVEVEHYSHEDMGDYTYVDEVATYELDKVKSVSEKIWLDGEGAGDIIINDGKFFGVVFFTGFTDYRGEEQYGFVPLEHIHDRTGLTSYCSAEISILLPKGADIAQATRHITGQDSGRTSRSWDINYYLEKRQ